MASTSAIGFTLIYLTNNLAAGLMSKATEEESVQLKGVLKQVSYAKCDMIIVSGSAFHGDGRSSISFTSLDHLHKTMDKIAIGHHVASMPCLSVILEEDNFAKGMEFIDFMEDLPENSAKRKKKLFIFITQNVDNSLLQNRTGNVNVHIISQAGKDEGLMITSLCPVLGKKNSIIRTDICPEQLQQPKGKELPISIIGITPFVIKDEQKYVVDGAELHIIAIYSKKFDFLPILKPAPSMDGSGGMIDMVYKKETEIGVGQASIVSHRYKKVDYLPSMFLNEFLVQSKKPDPIGKIDTLIYPLDKFCWYFMISSIFTIFITLIFIQKSWMIASGERPSNSWIFQDFILALTPVLDESIPWKFYLRNSFSTSRRLLLIQWLVMANILSHAYKGSILSSLINIHYEDPLDTIEQMVESGLPFYVLGKTSLEWVIKTDPRDSVKKLNARRFDMPWEGHTEEKYLKMIDRGEIMLHTSEQDIARYKNRHHFSKETIIVLPSAHAVPLGSPLVDIFHSTTHWLQDFGIFTKIMDPYLNAEPLIPLPKVRINEAFTVEQLIMLWLIWAIGLILGSVAFLFECISKL